MTERAKLLKKAVLTSVGATTNVERIKNAVEDAMSDLVKVGQNLLDDLEEKGKVKTESLQEFLKNLQSEAGKRTAEVEKKVSTNVQTQLRKAVREIGLITHEDWEEICDRLKDIEEALGIECEEGNGEHAGKRRGRRKKNQEG